MPKRKNKDSDDYIMRKIRKLEKKVRKRSQKRLMSSSPNSSDAGLSLQEDNQQKVIMKEATTVSDAVVNLSSPRDMQDSILHLIEPEAQIIESNTSEIPSISVDQIEPETMLDDNILELLGETPSKNKKYSLPIQNELAVRWEHIATAGLQKDVKKELFEKYFLSENCQKIGPPRLNAEIKAALSDTLIKKDKAIEIKQNQLAIAITCIGHALTKIFTSQNKDTDIIKLLLDSGRILCDSQYVESMSRRSFVTSTIKKDIKDQLYTTEIDSYLFGEKLSDTLKAAKAIYKSGAEMKNTSQPKTTILQPRFSQARSLNMRPPLPPARQTGAGRRPAVAQQPRRYQTPSLPPPHPIAYQTPLPPPPPPPPMPPQLSRGRTQIRR